MQHNGTQAGLSLVELMVALAISSVLILGITQIYIDNKRSYAFQQNQAENQEASRYTLLLLQQELAKAGYRRRPDVPFDESFPANNALGCGFAKARQPNSSALRITQFASATSLTILWSEIA